MSKDLYKSNLLSSDSFEFIYMNQYIFEKFQFHLFSFHLDVFLAQFFKKCAIVLYMSVRPFVSELASKRLEIETSDLLQKYSLDFQNMSRAIEILIFWTVSGPRAF